MAKKQLVTWVKLHQGFFDPAVGNFGETLPPSNKSTTTEMWVGKEGVYIKIGMLGKAGTSVIPFSNIVSFKLGAEVEEK